MRYRQDTARIIIFTPKGLRTGGPEAMHQLHQQLGQNSLLVPWPGTRKRQCVPQYSKYNPIWGEFWKIRRNDKVIIPESLGELPFYYFFFFSKQNLFLWMLSVDFSFEDKFQKYEAKNFRIHPAWQTNKKLRLRIRNANFQRSMIKLLLILKLKCIRLRNKYFRRKLNVTLSNYLFQSVYAREIFKLVNNSSVGFMLSDFTSIENSQQNLASYFCSCTKKHIAYFPAKSQNLIRFILEMNASQNYLFHFIAIQGLDPSQVTALLLKSDLFLDLGYFPGKDRLPREAIRLNCPVLLAKRGAARFQEDFPLTENYLLDLEKLDPKSTFEVIKSVLSKSKKYNIQAQDKFKKAVQSEKVIFKKEVRNLIQFMGNF